MSTARKGKNMSYAQRRQAQARQTERNILQAALTLMRERGFDKVSIRDICKQAGITTGAFYHHFPSKESLLNKGFAPLDDYMEAALRGHEADEPAERLGHILSAYARFMEEEGGELTGRYYVRRITDPTRSHGFFPVHAASHGRVLPPGPAGGHPGLGTQPGVGGRLLLPALPGRGDRLGIAQLFLSIVA